MSSFFGRDHPPCGEQYRGTTLGKSLQESLDVMIADGRLTPELAVKILIHFDVSINAHLGRCASNVTFRAARIKKYNEFKKVYTVIFKDFEVCGRGRCHPLQIHALQEVMIIAHPSSNQKKKAVQPVVEEPLPKTKSRPRQK